MFKFQTKSSYLVCAPGTLSESLCPVLPRFPLQQVNFVMESLASVLLCSLRRPKWAAEDQGSGFLGAL